MGTCGNDGLGREVEVGFDLPTLPDSQRSDALDGAGDEVAEPAGIRNGREEGLDGGLEATIPAPGAPATAEAVGSFDGVDAPPNRIM